MKIRLSITLVLLSYTAAMVAGQQCGRQAGGQTCAGNICCSQYGYCGTTGDYCVHRTTTVKAIVGEVGRQAVPERARRAYAPPTITTTRRRTTGI
ncbi:unnamed protein product [Brassica oleracea]|uniref:Chitin-binding type-1 domain-containing protein n=1 Tax=Brassica oleracea TaxID=3712 RepID=A0A3P6ARY4_BRAOL|nr:unnamed protein product [Brassica oleracea]